MITETEQKTEPFKQQTYYSYMVKCADGTFYCGYTTCLEKRMKAHNAGKGAKYTRSRRPVKLVYFEQFSTKHDAMSREWHMKRLNRMQKEQLAESFPDGFQEKEDEI